jgi:DNA-binding IclR family transcriptional regulator
VNCPPRYEGRRPGAANLTAHKTKGILPRNMAQRYRVPAVKRAFDIIELLATQDSGLNVSELQRNLLLPLSSVATIVYTLQDLGYLERDEFTSRYRLSVKMFGIARRALDRLDLSSRCHSLLQELVHRSGLTGHLAVLRSGESMYIDRVPSEGLVQVSSYVGMRWPLHTSAVGKALLAFLPKSELQQRLHKLRLRRVTPSTITSKHLFEKQLRSFRRIGYTWEQNEGEIGLGCVAAPVFGAHGEVVAAISLTGTTHQVSKDKLPSLGTLVKHYAQQMSVRMGNIP